MINVILKELDVLWNDYQNALEVFGYEHRITQYALRRWGAVNELTQNLGL